MIKTCFFIKLSTLCALFIILPNTAQAQAIKLQESFIHIQEVKSDSGIKAWLVQDDTVPVIAFQFAFEGLGTKNDPPEKQGLARILSNTMDEGAGELTSHDFQKTLQNKAISLSFSASRDHFSGQLKTLKRNKDKAFELLKLALTKPRFDEAPLTRMRIANQGRIKASLSNPRWIAARIQNDKIFEGHPYALNSGGTLSSLEAITADDLRRFHQKLARNTLVVAVAGDITPQELKTVLDDVFGALPTISPRPITRIDLENAGKTFLYKKDIPQTVIEITQPGISRSDPRFYTASIMNFILGESGFGSRLMEEIREKRGLTYGIYSYFRNFDATDTLHVSTSTLNENVPEMLSLIKAEWTKMKNTAVSEEDLANAKSYLIGSLPLSLTSTNSIASLLLSLQLDRLPIDYLDKRAEKFNAVTSADIQKTAKSVLNEARFTTILVGNPDIQNATAITDIPNVN